MIIIEYWKMKNPKHDEWCKNLLWKILNTMSDVKIYFNIE